MADTHIRPSRVIPNPFASGTLLTAEPSRDPLAFHGGLTGYAPTALVDAPDVAATLGVGRVWVKNEAERLGLPAFKVLGASWATYRALTAHLGIDTSSVSLGMDELRTRLAPALPLKLAAATDGNHGRAVARMARWLELDAEIFVPDEMVVARRAAIVSEGATVTVVDGSYDDAVERAAAEAGARCFIIADTAWPGYEDVPAWVIDGYSTILWEIEDELAARDEPAPDIVVMQIGVGAFAAAVTRHFRRPGAHPATVLIGVEPLDAACALGSIEAGEIIHVPGPHGSIMAGLNCGTPSPVAWPTLERGIDLFVAVDDEYAREAMRLLARSDIVAGESGAAGLAGLLALLREGSPEALRLTPNSRVLLFNTEGATDPEGYARIIGEGDKQTTS